MGELSLSSWVLEPCYTLENMIQLHLDSLGKVIKKLGGRLAGSTILSWAMLLTKFKPIRTLNYG